MGTHKISRWRLWFALAFFPIFALFCSWKTYRLFAYGELFLLKRIYPTPPLLLAAMAALLLWFGSVIARRPQAEPKLARLVFLTSSTVAGLAAGFAAIGQWRLLN
jgi:hypothetical protein